MTWNKDNIDRCSCLALGDQIQFDTKIYYSVERSFLNNCNGPNNIIFRHAGIKNDRAFCKEAYGYESRDGVFPECIVDDFTALTRVTKAIFDILYPKTTSGLVFAPISSIKIVL